MKTFLSFLSSFFASLPRGPWIIHSLTDSEAKHSLLKFAVVTSDKVPAPDVEKLIWYASTYMPRLTELAQLTSQLVSSVREKDDGFVVDALALSLVHNALVELERGA